MLHNHKPFNEFKKFNISNSRSSDLKNSASREALSARTQQHGFTIRRRTWEFLTDQSGKILKAGKRFMWRVAYKSRRRMRRARQALAERRRAHQERRRKSSPLSNPSSMLALEPRIVFDAAAAATVDQTADQVAQQQADDAVENGANDSPSSDNEASADDLASVTVTGDGGHEIAFVDGSLEDIDQLLSEIDPSVEIIMLDVSQDGVEQIAAALQDRDDIDAIHILSHGSPGELNLGTGTLTSDTIQGEYADELAVVRDALSEHGDILIYGCDFSAGTLGLEAAQLLSDVTGADIAASDDDTGHESLGGDWDLENTIGVINVEAIQAVNWEQLMAPVAITAIDGATTTAATLANNIAGNGVSIDTATFTGQNAQGGTFTSATGYPNEWLGYDSGIVLSSGNVVDAVGPNTGNSSTNHGGAGDADLTGLAGNTSFDASVLEINFTPTSNIVTLQFTFGSEEYNEYVYANFNDAIGIWVNGVHTSLTPTGDAVAIDAINQAGNFNPANGNQNNDPNPGNGVFDSANPSLYVNNSTNAFNTQMDGFTVTLSFTATVNIGIQNTIKIGVADIGDGAFDSWLFVRENSLQTNTLANNDFASTNINTAVTINALANDFDAEGDPLTITHVADQPVTAGGAAVTLATGATVQLTLGGQLLYTPATGQTGVDSFSYTISDGTGSTAVGFGTVQIGANVAPIVDLDDDGTSGTRDFAATFNEGDGALSVTANDAGIVDTNDMSFPSLDITIGGFLSSGNEIISIGGTDFTFGTIQTSNVSIGHSTVRIVYDGANGFAITNAALGAEISETDLESLIQSITYQHLTSAVTDGARTLSFQVSDGTTTSNIAVSTINVIGVDTPPAVDLDPTDAPTPVVAASDDFESGGLTGGTGWNGNWTTTFTGGGNAADVAVVTDSGDNSLRIDDDGVQIQRSADLSGSATATLTFDYRRNGLDNANDSISIQVSNSSTGPFTEVGRIQGAGTDGTYQPFSADISAYISADTTVRFVTSGTLGNNDRLFIDDVAITTVASNPTGHSGSYQVGEPAVSIASTSGADVTDPDQNVDTATITLTNPFAGDALSVTGTLPAGITATISGGGTVVTLSGIASSADYETALEAIGFSNNNPSADLTTRTITVQLEDATSLTSNTATATITMIANAAPTLDLDASGAGTGFSGAYTENGPAVAIADSDSLITDADDTNMESASIVLTNYQSGDQFIIGGTPVSNGSTGTINGISYTVTLAAGQLTINLNGPATNAIYADTIEAISYSSTSENPSTTTRTIDVTVNDGAANSNTATTSITVARVNDNPDAVDDGYSTNEDTALNIPANGVLGNDSDLDGDTITVQSHTAASNGTVVVNGDGSFTYTPNADFNGTDTFTYTLSDGNGGSDTATVTITVDPVNDLPVTNPDTATTPEDTPVVIDVLANDSDPEGGALTVTEINGTPITIGGPGVPVTGGVVTLNPTGTVTFTPTPDFNGTPSFTYTVEDPDGGTGTGTASVTVTPVNDAPVVNPDTAATPENTPVIIDVLANDSDPDGEPLTVTEINGTPITIGGPGVPVTGGAVTLNPTGTVTFTPTPDFNGTPSFTYTAEDPSGTPVSSNVTVNVQNPDDTQINIEYFDVVLPPDHDLTTEPQSNSLDDIEVGGIIVDTVEDFGQIRSTSLGPSVDGIVVDTVNSVDTLGGMKSLGNGEGSIATVIEDVDVMRAIANEADRIFGRTATEIDINSWVGFSLRMDVGGLSGLSDGDTDGQIIVDTLMRKNILYIQITNTLDSTDKGRVLSYKIMQADGRPMPEWLSISEKGLLLGEVPADNSPISIKIIALHEDGTTTTRSVTIQTATGEVQPFDATQKDHAVNFNQQLQTAESRDVSDLREVDSFLTGNKVDPTKKAAE